MADKEVDTRGLSCPQPVLDAKAALDSLSSGKVEVLVDTVTSRNNVTRMAEKQGCKVEIEGLESGDYRLTITKGGE